MGRQIEAAVVAVGLGRKEASASPSVRLEFSSVDVEYMEDVFPKQMHPLTDIISWPIKEDAKLVFFLHDVPEICQRTNERLALTLTRQSPPLDCATCLPLPHSKENVGIY